MHLLASPTFAQNDPPRLSADVVPLSRIQRNGAAFPVAWTVRYEGSKLLEGQIRYDVYDGDKLLARFRTDELVLNPGVRQFSTVLPPFDIETWSAGSSGSLPREATVRIQFVTKKGLSISLPDKPLLFSDPDRRQLTIAVISTLQGAQLERTSKLVERLRIPESADTRATVNEALPRVSTISTYLTPDDLPSDALALCGFDLVVLTGPAFARLRERKLNAVGDWVAAGGSLYVQPEGALEAHHAAFLNRLAEQAGRTEVFVLDGAGRLPPLAEQSPPEVFEFRTGVGRAVVARTAEAASANPADLPLAEARAFLWKMRAVAPPETDEAEAAAETDGGMFIGNPASRRGVKPISSGDWLFQNLIPNTIEVMPVWVLGAILLTYIMVIGPVDYSVLGLLRLRKFTWIAFPLVTLMFAAFTLWLSKQYMQNEQERGAVVFVDVGTDGRVVRTNRLELLLPNTHTTYEREIGREMFTPMNHQAFGVQMDRRLERMRGKRIDDAYEGAYGEPVTSVTWDGSEDFFIGPGALNPQMIGPTVYEGAAPRKYTVTQTVPQWTPQLNRRFQIAPGDDFESTSFDWAALTVKDFETQSGRERLQEVFGESVAIVLYQGEGSRHIVGSNANAAKNSFIHQCSVRRRDGYFKHVARISPTGGNNFEDLALLDSTNPREWLLLVIVRGERDGEVVVYRKLYRSAVGVME